MKPQSLAENAYTTAAIPTRTPRRVEYDLFAKVTHNIKSAAQAGPKEYPKLVQALSDNRKLWTTLAMDVADDENKLPAELRAQVFYLAEFVQMQTGRVLSKKGRLRPILEINAAILQGLRGRSNGS